MDNYYKILGVKNFASFEEIKSAYKKLVKKFHPDVNDGDKLFEEKFKELQLAYQTLSGTHSKNIYDKNLIEFYQIFKQIQRMRLQAMQNATANQGIRRAYPPGRVMRRSRF